MHTRARPAKELRFAIECLPEHTRRAMLDGINANRIIVGAYTDGEGGVCPMLAAHRCGGRTSLASFARAWDHYTGAGGRARRASQRELLTLKTMLEAGLYSEEPGRSELAAAVAEVKAAKARRAAERAQSNRRRRRDTGERDRTHELRRREGWAWLRPFRRYDEYEAALERLAELEDRLVNERRLDVGDPLPPRKRRFRRSGAPERDTEQV